MSEHDVKELTQNREIDLLAAAAVELAASSPHCPEGAAALVSYAETMLIGAVIKLGIAYGLEDVDVFHKTIDMLWEHARVGITNSSGGEA